MNLKEYLPAALIIAAQAIVISVFVMWVFAIPIWVFLILCPAFSLLITFFCGQSIQDEVSNYRKVRKLRRIVRKEVETNSQIQTWLKCYPEEHRFVVGEYLAVLICCKPLYMYPGLLTYDYPALSEGVKLYLASVERRYARAGYRPLTLNHMKEAFESDKDPEGLVELRGKGKVEYPLYRYLYRSWILNPDLLTE